MLKKSITYKTFDGEEVTEDFYFNYTKAEIAEMELSRKGGLKEHLERIVAAEDGKEIIREFKSIVLGALGQKSADGKRFIKTQEYRDEFESSEAYSVLFMETLTETDAAIEFVNGIVPQDLKDDQLALDEPARKAFPDGQGPKKLTKEEVIAMDGDELRSGLATGKYVIADDVPS